MEKQFVDANIFLYAIQNDEDRGTASRKILERENIVTSALVIDEIMHSIQKQVGKGKIFRKIHSIYNLPNLTIVSVGAHLPLEAAKILAEHNLRPRDAIHLVTMQQHNIKTILSFDKDFDRVSSITRVEP